MAPFFVPQPQKDHRHDSFQNARRPRRHPAPERAVAPGGYGHPHQPLPRYVPRTSRHSAGKRGGRRAVGTLQHSGLRLPASGRLPGRAAGTRHQRRPPAPLCCAQRDALHGRPARAHARPAPRKARRHHAAAHHPRPVRLFRLRHGELLQQEAGHLPAPKGRRRQPCSAGNRARVRPPVQPAVPAQPWRTQGRERRTDAGMRRGPALHRRRCRDRHAGTGKATWMP